MSFGKNLKEAIEVMLHPGRTTSREMTIAQSLKFYYSIMIIPLILGFVIGLALHMQYIAALLIFYFIIGFPLGIVIDAGIYHIIIGKLFRLYRGNYTRVVNAFTFAIIPSVFIFWIVTLLGGAGTVPASSAVMGTPHMPGISGLRIASIILISIFEIWSFIIMLFALSNQLTMSKLKAFGTLVLESVIIIGVIVALSVTVGYGIGSLFSHLHLY